LKFPLAAAVVEETMRTIRRLTALASWFAVTLAASSALAQSAGAQNWPQRTVRLIIPLPPGTGTDIAGRMLAERLAERWGQPVIVENRQGADGIPAVTTFLAARDTHLLLLSFAGIISINPLLHEKLPYDPIRDLVPIAPVTDNFLGVSVNAALKAGSLADLVGIAKPQPGKLNWAATPGLPYYVVLALQRSAGIQMTQVSYRDFAPAFQDLSQGRLQVAATGVPALVPHHQAGAAKLIFVTNRQRSPQAPDVPTATEAGYPDLTFEGTVGIFGWRDFPADIKARIVTDVQAATSDPAFRARLVSAGTAARPGSSADFAAAIEDQRAKIAAIHQANATSKP
jgi:tripartite-type tricarboxylate transporter receptor subunit TctC